MYIEKNKRGFVLILSMIFVVIFATLALSLGSISNNNVQIAKNQQSGNKALSAALSGVEYGKFLCRDFSSGIETAFAISQNQKDTVWEDFKAYALDTSNPPAGNQFTIPTQSYSADNSRFGLVFTRSAVDPNSITMKVTGQNGEISKIITMGLEISKDSRVLKYAVASRGRIWLTSDTVVDGDIYSTWDATTYGSAGIETTSEVINNGTINIVNTLAELESVSVQMETLDANNNPVFDSNGNRVHSPEDALQGHNEGVNYGLSEDDMPGLDEDDYDTSAYRAQCIGNTIPVSGEIITEYFPHYSGDYTRSKAGSKTFNRHVYRNITFTDSFLPKGRNALFVNCTFEGIFFIESDSYTTYTSRCNNVRFDDCQFNGVIITDVPKNSKIKWRENCLYFTGGAIFENQWSQQEATILAPNFNVNLGNTTELELDQSSQLKGAVVGGIVDVRGIVDIDGTIISMYDTSIHSRGYVTNIGSTSGDGGNEGGAFSGEDIDISPSQKQMMPDGIKADVIISFDTSTYKEG